MLIKIIRYIVGTFFVLFFITITVIGPRYDKERIEHEKEVIKQRELYLQKLNSSNPYVKIKKVFIEATHGKHHKVYDRCIVEDKFGTRYILDIDTENGIIPVDGEIWSVTYYYDCFSQHREIVPKLTFRIKDSEITK